MPNLPYHDPMTCETNLITRTCGPALLLAVAVLAVAGCDRNTAPVQSSDGPRRPPMTPEAGRAAVTPNDPTVAEFLGLRAPKPEAWAWQPSSNQMRVANYLVARPEDGEDVQVVVYFFGPDMGGGVAENIDRWAGQFQSETGGPVVPSIEQGEVDGMEMTRVELHGAYRGMGSEFRPDHTFLAAIVEAPQGRIFIRLVGPTAIVEDHREAFDAMIDGLHQAG